MIAMVGPVPPHWGGGGRWTGGGVATHVSDLLPALTAHGVLVRLLAENTDRIAPEVAVPDAGSIVRAITRSWPTLLRWGGGATPVLAARLLAPVPAGPRVPLAQAARYLGLAINYRRFFDEHNGRLVHLHGARHGPYLCRRALRLRCPLVVTVHSVNRLVEPGPEWLRAMIRANLRDPDHLIAVSSFVRRQVERLGAPADRISLIPNAVDIDRFASGGDRGRARALLELPAESRLVLFTGNLVARKGVGRLIAAFARADRAEPTSLVIVGDGPDRASLEGLASELAVSRAVRFAGARPLPEMGLWYQACDVFVLPSSAEGLSIALLEAMACGRPVITTRPTEGDHDAVIEGENGLLVEVGDVDGLARAIELVLDRSDTAARLADAARTTIETRFTWDRIAEQTIDVYRQVMESAQGRGDVTRRLNAKSEMRN
jgi:glycosyltransferase involved in cell wall biosynthesis